MAAPDSPVTYQPVSTFENLVTQLNPISSHPDDISIPEVQPLKRTWLQLIDKAWLPRFEGILAAISYVIALLYLALGIWVIIVSFIPEDNRICKWVVPLLYKIFNFIFGCLVGLADAGVDRHFLKWKMAEPCCDDGNDCGIFNNICKRLDDCCLREREKCCKCETECCKGLKKCCKDLKECFKGLIECLKLCKYIICCEWCKCCDFKCDCKIPDTCKEIYYTILYIIWYIISKIWLQSFKKAWETVQEQEDAECNGMMVALSDFLLGLSIIVFVLKALKYCVMIFVWFKNRPKTKNFPGAKNSSGGTLEPSFAEPTLEPSNAEDTPATELV